jgi:phosphatidylinositol glycan class B
MMFCSYSLFQEERQRKAAVKTISLLGFLPYMLVRTSSEALSSSFSMIGFALLILGSVKEDGASFEKRRYPGKTLFITGVLWGLAFEFRYQCAFLIAGFVFWMLFVSINKKDAVKCAAIQFSGIIFSMLLCTAIDVWGYGAFIFAPWKYLEMNIFQNIAGIFGTMPFWGYFDLIVTGCRFKPAVILTILLTIGTLCAWVRYPRHPLTWGTFLFFIAHCLVGHKELRFLMNMAVPSIILTVCAFSPQKNKNSFSNQIFEKLWDFLHLFPLKLFYGGNILILCFYLIYLNNSDLAFEKYIYRNTSPPFYAFSVGGHPYGPWGSGELQYDWYKPDNVSIIEKDSYNDILLSNHEKAFNLIVHGDDNKPDMAGNSTFLFDEVRGSKSGLLTDRFKILLGLRENEQNSWRLYQVKVVR